MEFTQGSSYNGFVRKSKSFINEINSEVYLFEHVLLGCPLMAIKNDDPNKTFCAAFNTIPADSTGVAHILEHSVLMGSKKYPVKDVFGEINKGGLTTFLNAMTGSDITYYPFATRNLKEYFNIMDVYCDVVFNPLLTKSTFEQEGWHYHQESEDQSLQFQGVVYNEMKGAFSDPVRHIFHHIFSGLLPGSTYAHESGGDPKNIPDLSYEDFCDFHKAHYHPSNSILFVYGDAPLEDELCFLQDNYLSTFDTPGNRATIEKGTPVTKPQLINAKYSVDSTNLEEKTFLAVGTILSTVEKREENVGLQIIANILFNSDGSPLKNGIISNGLCKDFGGFYLSNSSYKTIMISYLVGSEGEKRKEFEDLYKKILKEMIDKGLDKELLLSELNKFEFNFREEASKAQRGLDLISKSLNALKYNLNPLDFLQSENLIKSIRHKALNENYFETLISSYLLDNPSTVTVTLSPDPELQKNNEIEIKTRLNAFDAQMSIEAKKEVIEKTNQMIKEQQEPNSEETLTLLPQLTLSDLSQKIDFHTVNPTTMFNREVLVSELPTNRITYFDIGFDLSCLPPDLLPLVDLFGTIVTEIGTKKLTFQQFAKEIATCTGSFSHSVSTFTNKKKSDSTKPVLWFHIKCLPDYLEKALVLLSEVFSTVSFRDKARIREIIGREFAWAEHSVQSEGYALPSTRVFAHLSKAGRYSEMFNGVTTYLATKDLVLNYNAKEEQLLNSFKTISQLLFNKRNLLLSLTAEDEELSLFEKVGHCIVDGLSDTQVSRYDIPEFNFVQHEAFITAAEVVFAVQGGNLFKDAIGYNGHFEVLKTYLSRDYLWNTVRQMGGAYGCFIQFGLLSGNLAFVSYRDPQVKKTYDAYDAIPTIIKELELSDKVMEQLIVGTYGTFDPLQSPAAKGATARNDYLNGIDIEFKQQRLAEITSTSIQDLRNFAEPFHNMIPNCHKAIIGNRAKIENDSALFNSIIEL